MKILALAMTWFLCAGCDTPDINSDQVTSAANKSKEMVDDARNKAGDQIDKLGDEAASYDADLDAWLEGAEKGSIEEYVSAKSGTAAELASIAKALQGSVSSETVLLPIYRPVAADGEDIDKAVAHMPRTEVIDGVTVGFKRLNHLDTKKRVKEEGYLVLWRRDDHLVGFVYRTKSTIDIDVVVKQAPRLIAVVNAR